MPVCFRLRGPPRGAPTLLVVLGTDLGSGSRTRHRLLGPPLLSGGGGLPTARQPLQSPRWMNVVDLGISTADGVKGSCLGSSAVKSLVGGTLGSSPARCDPPFPQPPTPRGHVHRAMNHHLCRKAGPGVLAVLQVFNNHDESGRRGRLQVGQGLALEQAVGAGGCSVRPGLL